MLDEISARRIEYALEAMQLTQREMDRLLKSRLDDFARAVLAGAGQQLNELQEAPARALFASGVPTEAREFIAANLVRLLRTQYGPFEDPEFRQSAVTLFDEVYKDTLYASMKLANKQTYEKLNELAQASSSAEQAIAGLAAGRFALISLREVQSRLMRLVKAPPTALFITPFLPAALLTSRLDELFHAVLAVGDAEPSTFVSTYDRAIEESDGYASDAREFGSRYSVMLLAGLADQLKTAADEYFRASPFSQRAVLDVTLSEKRYPLAEPNTDFAVQCVVTNRSAGHASNVSVVIEEAEGLHVPQPVVGLGSLGPGTVTVPIEVQVTDGRADPRLLVTVHWTNTDRTGQSAEAVLDLPAQRGDVPWMELRRKQPYTLQPVTREEDLVGRGEILERLLSTIVSDPPMGNAIISGQRRVGKTSIANAVLSRVRAQASPFVGASLLAGPSGGRDLAETVRNFGRATCRAVRSGLALRQRSDKERQAALGRAQSISIPTFDAGLAPLVEYLEDVRDHIPAVRLVLVIDEFDELPAHVFAISPVARAFFNTFRQIAGDPCVSVILVGGENLAFALKEHADTQNLFRPFPVDYFDRSRYWGDFTDLVRAPVSSWLDVSDGAVAHLYKQTAGHPYFTKMICERAFDASVKAHDAYISVAEIDEATTDVAKDANASSFAHFWQDAIFEASQDTKKTRDVERRLVLHGVAHCLRKTKSPTSEAIDEEIRFPTVGVPTSDVLSEFVQRHILTDDEGVYGCRIAVFQRWLLEHGPEHIVVTPEDVRRLRVTRNEISRASDPSPVSPSVPRMVVTSEPELEEISYPTPDEIVRLIDRWGTYRGQAVTTDLVRRWLGQFGEPQHQRVALRLLQRLRFYGAPAVREKLGQAGEIVKSGLQVELPKGVKKRRDIAIGYLDGAGKSGAQWARNFAQQHGIHGTNVLEQGALAGTTIANPDVRVLVFLDDFVGTGTSASDNFTKLNTQVRGTLTRAGLRVEFIAAAGFQPGVDKLEERLADLQLPVRVSVLEVLGDEDRCFHERSRIFPEPEEREFAKRLLMSIGRGLAPRSPVGFGDSQAVVVFSDSCPNNSLPVLWQEADNWKPLFPRF